VKVDIKIIFSLEEIRKLCEKACSGIDAGQEGSFVADDNSRYLNEVTVRFVPKEQEKDDRPLVQPPAPPHDPY
jgi:hypothetical protein